MTVLLCIIIEKLYADTMCCNYIYVWVGDDDDDDECCHLPVNFV